MLASHKTHRRNGIGIRNKHRHFRVRCGKNGFSLAVKHFFDNDFLRTLSGTQKLALVADNEFVALAQNHTSAHIIVTRNYTLNLIIPYVTRLVEIHRLGFLVSVIKARKIRSVADLADLFTKFGKYTLIFSEV